MLPIYILFFKADSGNGLFDCKVLSRQHAMLIYEDERFYILDTGSSNGTFVNNIRLSKTGEESKMTEVFTGDIIRFGSDIVDKVWFTSFFCKYLVSFQLKFRFSEKATKN